MVSDSPIRRTVWMVTSFDPSIPMTLQLVLDSPDPDTALLVEQAAAQWDVDIERTVEGWILPSAARDIPGL